MFTNKHSAKAYEFAGQVNITKSDFINYLQLKELETSGLNIIFDDDYVRSVYHDLSSAARASARKCVLAELTQEDLNCVLDLAAYTLANAVSWVSLVNQNIDITGMRLCLSAEQLTDMRPENIAKVLYFLLEANLAYVETEYEDNSLLSADKLAEKVLLLDSMADLEKIFGQYNICLISPLWYTKLSKEILGHHNISLDDIFESPILGEIIENYIKGSYCRFNSGVNYHLYKIGSVLDKDTNIVESSDEEVNLFDPKLKLLFELSKGNNKQQQVPERSPAALAPVFPKGKLLNNLMKHYANIAYIRIISSEAWPYEKSISAARPCNPNEDIIELGINKIAFPRLCAMVDTGHIFSLDRTVDTSQNDKRAESIPCD